MSWVEIVIWVGGVISVLLALGAGLALVRSSYNAARIVALREDNTDLRNRIDDQDRELERCAAREDVSESKIHSLETENELLTQMVTQRADVDQVLQELKNHHRQAIDHWTKMTEAIERIGRNNDE